MGRALAVTPRRWRTKVPFAIARGSVDAVETVVVELHEEGRVGRGECRPYARYGETVAGVIAELRALADALGAGLDREGLRESMPAGAARNAIDSALWDLEAKVSGRPAWALAGLPEPTPVVTAYTLSLGSPEAMREAARSAASHPLLKVKLGAPGDPERLAAVREGAPGARLIVDANEGWTGALLAGNLAACARVGVELVEQPLPAGDDARLEEIDVAGLATGGVLVCADESAHDRASLGALAGRYSAINIKLDKTGGLTEARDLVDEARALDLKVMVGCMLASSLAMAPAFLLAPIADVVDLDGPLLLAEDWDPPIRFVGSLMHPPTRELWG
jgi:L-alanine-DL-glutamate epimerase-like enolase superfamily enzyme